ncbi:hypothetical protein ABPG74_014457 [Tetrahymena malaccensis]
MGNSGLRKLLFAGDIVESPYRSLSDIKVINLDKEEVFLGDLTANKYAIVVNTGSQNPNFKQLINELNQFKQENKDKLEILAFPCNQFYNEPLNFKNIKDSYSNLAQFPVFQKVEVNGSYMHPLYKFLKRHSSLYNYKLLNGAKITEDFSKFLINTKGEVVSFYTASTPLSQIQKDLDTLKSSQN